MAKKKGNTRPSYPPEFRRRMIELVRSGRSPEVLSREFEPTAQSIRSWARQADLDDGKRTDGLTSEEHEELIRLRREVRTLREEREILKNGRVRHQESPVGVKLPQRYRSGLVRRGRLIIGDA
jgi:transposase